MKETPKESAVEQAALEWLGELGYAVAYGPDIAPGEKAAERDGFGEVVLWRRLREAVARINPEVPEEAREEAIRRVLRPETTGLAIINRRFHALLRDGVEVEYRRADGSIAGDRVRLIDFAAVANNDWQVVNQVAVEEAGHKRRLDLVVFVNGLPLAVFELKNPTNQDTTIWSAFHQLQTYKAELPSLMQLNELLVISDGLQARLGSLTASQEWFKVWRTVDGEKDAPDSALELAVLVRGVFERRRLLTLLEHFIVFEEDPDTGAVHKIIAGYHQFYAVNTATVETLRASGLEVPSQMAEEVPGTHWAGPMKGGDPGDRRAGVVWHTQGSGKSFSMLFYAGRMVRHPAMRNPTIVVLTDRNDLDDQLFGQFQRCQGLLGQKSVQAESRERLRELLAVASGGVVFTTIQKFVPETKGERFKALSDRRNILVIADEAHRSQYEFGSHVVKPKEGERYRAWGLARNLRDALPGASFIGFTGTPIEKNDANTQVVFGNYISVYDIERAVADKATVPIYYESRVVKLALNEAAANQLDEEFEQITEGEEFTSKEKLKLKWAALEALVGDPKRIALVAADIVQHFERRGEVLNGKAMIVGMSRRICVELYDALTRLRPEWAGAKGDDAVVEEGQACVVKVIMTGSAEDGPEWQPHIRTKEQRRVLANRFKDSKDPFRIVIVRDMWLTGFDAPCLHTMYVDKPMAGHGLMQAIARVNRVFRDKPSGLVVDYLGLAEQLREALQTYRAGGGKGDPTQDTAKAEALLREEHRVLCEMLHQVDWRKWSTGSGEEQLALIPEGQEAVLSLEEGKKRFSEHVVRMTNAFALCAASETATAVQEDLAYFQAVRAALEKKGTTGRRSPDQLDAAVRQLVSTAITTEGEVIDVFTAAGLEKPDVSILSDEFLSDIRGLKHQNVAAELLEKLLSSEVAVRRRRNVVQSENLRERLKRAIEAYHQRSIRVVELIEELISMAKELRAADERGEELGLSTEEVAFYDALADNDSAKAVMGDEKLRVIAAELVSQVRRSVTIDWTLRQSAQAAIRVRVKRILRKFGFPPDLQDAAVQLVLDQAKVLCADWAESPKASDGPSESVGQAPGSEIRTVQACKALPAHLLDDPSAVPVWFGTNRKPVDPTSDRYGFGAKPDSIMHYGYCMVNIPQSYVKGGSGRGWLGRLIAGESTRLELGCVVGLSEADFWGTLGATLRVEVERGDMLLFIHGYNNTFQDAIEAVGQLSYELDVRSTLFSWASCGKPGKYLVDEERAREAAPLLKTFLRRLALETKSAGKRLHVVAHSMGNRALLQVLHEIALDSTNRDTSIAQVIFAAPDVSQREFIDRLDPIVKVVGLSGGNTLYMAKNDKALWASMTLHENPRAGATPPVTVAPHLESVDVSNYNLSLLGHGYCTNLAAVIDDIASVLEGRKSRRRKKGPGGKHWVLG